MLEGNVVCITIRNKDKNQTLKNFCGPGPPIFKIWWGVKNLRKLLTENMTPLYSLGGV